MDKAGEKQRLESELLATEQYLDHPITRLILGDSKEQQEQLINLLTSIPVRDIETFFAHFEAIGHLRGLRRMQAIIDSQVEETKDKLKEL